MKNLKGRCVFAQSGGPTTVINASIAGGLLEALENDYYEYDDDDECCCDDCCCDDDECYEVECPACGESICVDGSIVEEGEMDCPACGEHLEFDFDEDEEDEE